MTKPKKANNKTAPHDGDVHKFINSVEHEGRRDDALVLLELFQDITGEKPAMWGPTIVGFGSYHYVYETGREGDCMLTGFSPRKANMVVYVMDGFDDFEDDLAKLGKHRTGKSCLYLGRLDNIDLKVLRRIVTKSVKQTRKNHS